MTTDFERRVAVADGELRAVGNKLIGIIPYGKWSEDLGGFREKLAPGVFTKSLREFPDVPLLLEHSPPAIARAPVTMTLRDMPDGLHIEAVLDDGDTDATRLKTKVQRRDIKGLSFGMRVNKKSDRWNNAGTEREIVEARLVEISPVTFPAYPSTEVAMRSLSEFRRANDIPLPAWQIEVENRERHIQLMRMK